MIFPLFPPLNFCSLPLITFTNELKLINHTLIRLEHIFEVNEDPKYSRPRRVSLRDLFTPFVVTEATEMTLSGTTERRVAEATRFRWFPNVDPYANYSNVLTQLDSEDLGNF